MRFYRDSAACPDATDLADQYNPPASAGARPGWRAVRSFPGWLRANPSIVALAALLVVINSAVGIAVVRGLHHAYAQVRAMDSDAGAVALLRHDADELSYTSGELLLSGQPEMLGRYRAARQRIGDEIARLRTVAADMSGRQQLDAMQQAVARQAGALDAALARHPPPERAALLQAAIADRQRSEALRGLIDVLQQRVLAARAVRFDALEQRLDRAFAVSEVRTVMNAGLIALMLLLIWRDRRMRGALALERAAALDDAQQALVQETLERRQAEQSLRSRELTLRGLADAIPQMVFEMFPDGAGEFLNRRWRDYTGAPDRFSRDPYWDRMHPDDAPAVTDRWFQAVRQMAPFAAEFRVRGKDGQYRWFLAQSMPIAEADDGRGRRWVGALTDIHDVRRTDAALRASEDRFRRIFEGSPFGITLSEGANRRILQANPAFCRMVGYQPEELIGRSLLDITHPEEAVAQRAFPELDGVGPGWRMREKRYLTRQGGVVWARIRVSVFDARAGGGPQLLAVVEDITRQRDADEALRQAQRMEAIGQLSGGLAHDFNNLLGVIIGNTECLLEMMTGDPERAELANEVLESALGGAELTRRLLAFGRRQALSPQQIDLGVQAARHVTLLSRTLGRGIRVETTFAGDLWPVLADPSQLGDALLNLAINARDAMPHGGVLSIETHNDRVDEGDAIHEAGVAPGDYAVLAVSDTGIGMPPEVRARAIEPFFTTKPPGAGSGLGLSMIYGFVRQSGGNLTISSEVGTGTTVSIHLPRAVAASAPARLTPRCNLPNGNETILVVDDSTEMRQVAERHLRALGYLVLCAENGPAALSLLHDRRSVDLLFTDIAMPEGLTGFQLAEAASALRPGLKVLFTTGYAGTPDVAGTPDWQERLIRKPYRRFELAERIRAALSS